MSTFDKLIVAISEYGITCINEGAFVNQPEQYKEFNKKRKEQFAAVLNEIGKYRDSLLKKEKTTCKQ